MACGFPSAVRGKPSAIFFRFVCNSRRAGRKVLTTKILERDSEEHVEDDGKSKKRRSPYPIPVVLGEDIEAIQYSQSKRFILLRLQSVHFLETCGDERGRKRE